MLEDRGVTAMVTGEQVGNALTRHRIEEFVSDCVIVLSHRMHEEISTRRLRIVKYRGSAHGTNEYPFLISGHGFVVLPITSVTLDYGAAEERISTGVARLDHMLGGGLFRGSTILVSGDPGQVRARSARTSSTRPAHRVRGRCWSCSRSPRPGHPRHRSVGLDLGRWVEEGPLRMWAARPAAFGLESHLAILAQLIGGWGQPSPSSTGSPASLTGPPVPR